MPASGQLDEETLQQLGVQQQEERAADGGQPGTALAPIGG
jgi:hypothetical protein